MLRTLPLAALATLATFGVMAAEVPHAASASRLVDQLDLAHTDYVHGPGSVTWSARSNRTQTARA